MLRNESRGLSKRAIEMADYKANIPMLGMVQSLNLSVTASIFLFEMNRQRKSSEGLDFSLDGGAKARLVDDFLQKA